MLEFSLQSFRQGKMYLSDNKKDCLRLRGVCLFQRLILVVIFLNSLIILSGANVPKCVDLLVESHRKTDLFSFTVRTRLIITCLLI